MRVVTGGRRGDAVRALIGSDVWEDRSASGWAFRRSITPGQTGGPSRIWIRDLHLAFPAGQVQGTRLVLTQSTYQLQRWLAWLDLHPGTAVVADAEEGALTRSAPEVLARRGPWQRITIHRSGSPDDATHAPAAASPLRAAFVQHDPALRLTASREALEAAPEDPALLLCLASSCMEVGRLPDAHDALERARLRAPDWEAVHFELGKLWLRAEETGQAAEAFAEAGRLMPSFAAAFSNLGAALGELDRSDEALQALERALALDPTGHPVANNLGTLYRELGRLEEAESAFRRVIDLAPAFVFGYYNLGHTLLLAGRFAEARDAYAEGARRDPQSNARQASRLAIARAAAGDASGAIADLDALSARVPSGGMRELMEEAESTLTALSAMEGMDAAGIARVLARVRGYSS